MPNVKRPRASTSSLRQIISVETGIDMRKSEISVVLADGNKNMQSIVRGLLHGLGIKRVFHAGDGAEALDILSRMHIDVVICELEMTPIDGLEFLRFLRWSSDSPAPKVPVIVLSSPAAKRKIMAARDAGATEFIVKPVSSRVLQQRIETVLWRPRDFVSGPKFNGHDRRRRKDAWDRSERRSTVMLDDFE